MKTRQVSEFDQATAKFSRFVKPLSTDANLFRLNSYTPTNHTFRRAYVRSVFSLIDGIISTIKREMVEEYDITDEAVSTRIRHILESKIKTTDGYGVLRERLFFAPIAEDVKVTIEFFAYFNLVEYYPDYEGRGWRCFLKARDIRHRITHPKSEDALEISDEELAIVDSARHWFIRTIMLIYEKIAMSLLAQREALMKAHPLNENDSRFLRNPRPPETNQLNLFAAGSEPREPEPCQTCRI